jgi:hypothetical protein
MQLGLRSDRNRSERCKARGSDWAAVSAGKVRSGRRRTLWSIYPTRGHVLSFSDTTVGIKGQSIEKQGSSWRTPVDASGV